MSLCHTFIQIIWVFLSKESETPNLHYFRYAVGGSIPLKIGEYHYFKDSFLFEKLSSEQLPVAKYSYAEVHKTLPRTVSLLNSSLNIQRQSPPIDQAQSVTIVYISKVFSSIYFSFQLILKQITVYISKNNKHQSYILTTIDPSTISLSLLLSHNPKLAGVTIINELNTFSYINFNWLPLN